MEGFALTTHEFDSIDETKPAGHQFFRQIPLIVLMLWMDVALFVRVQHLEPVAIL
jgi:hypothetical protein